jgi:hypothetical protein
MTTVFLVNYLKHRPTNTANEAFNITLKSLSEGPTASTIWSTPSYKSFNLADVSPKMREVLEIKKKAIEKL